MSSEAFEKIYADHAWGGTSRSGPGSDPEHAQPYLRHLQSLIDSEPEIRSVVDIGCGDWALSKTIRWGSKNYIGIDVVPGLIQRLQQQYAKPASGSNGSVGFECRNFRVDEIPAGDLLISKDVLQHLPLAAVHQFLNEILPKFRFALITNDWYRYHLKLWPLPRPRTKVGEVNGEIEPGGWRPLHLLQPPFSLRAQEALRYVVPLGRRTLDEKQVLFWRR